MLEIPNDACVRESFKLYQNLTQKLHKKNRGKEEKISALFLVRTGVHFEFIKKRSFYGKFISIINNLNKKLGRKEKLDFETNIEKCSAILEKITKMDEDSLEKIAHTIENPQHKGKSLSGKELQKAIHELGTYLETLCLHVETKRNLKNVTKKSHQEQYKLTQKITDAFRTVQTKKEVVSSTELPQEETIEAFFKKTYGKDVTAEDFSVKRILSEEYVKKEGIDVETISKLDSIVSSCSNKNRLFRMLFDPSLSQEQKVSALQCSLWREISLVSTDSDTVNIYKKLIDNLGHNKITPTTVNLKEFGIVFGDSFIRGSSVEGYYGQHFIQIATDFLKSVPSKTEVQQKILSLCEHRIDLTDATVSSSDLCHQIKEQVDKEGKCLLVGGWDKHAICYEIEKKGKTYRFKVFNEGDGIRYHTQYSPQYQKKIAPCISVGDIKEENLFQEHFFSCLQSLCSVREVEGKSAASLLALYLLPMLKGKGEPLPSHVQAIVSPQRSGTCTYKSFKAFLAASLPEQEYKRFIFDFELFLLDHYQLLLEQEVKQTILESTYEQTKEYYAVTKRSIERFDKAVERMEPTLSPLEVEESRARVIAYTLLLQQLEKKIIAFEKQKYTHSIENILSHSPFVVKRNQLREISFELYSKAVDIKEANEVIDPQYEKQGSRSQDDMSSSFIHEKIRQAFNLIENLPEPDLPQFSEHVEHVLKTIAKITQEKQLGLTTEDILYMQDAFFRKVGRLDTLATLSFTNPSQAMSNFSEIATFLYQNISRDSSSEQYLMFLMANRGLELAYRQSKEKFFLEKDSPSLLDQRIIPQLAKMQCSDPFWVDIAHEMTSFAEKNSTIYFETADKCQSLSEPLAKAVWKFWERQENASMRQKVQDSIAQDRRVQEIEITYEESKCKQDIESNKSEIKRLEALNDGTKETLNKLSTHKSLLYKNQNRLNTIRTAVEEDPQYWPKGFEYGDSSGGKNSLQYKAPFLYAQTLVKKYDVRDAGSFYRGKLSCVINHSLPEEVNFLNDPFPSEFRCFCDAGFAVANIFNKKNFSDGVVKYQPQINETSLKENKLLFFGQNPPGYSAKVSKTFDRYEHRIDPASSLHKLYTSLSNYRPQNEPDVPRYVSEIFGNGKLDGIGIDEAVEITSVSCNREMQVDAVLNFFQEHRTKLREPSFINIFHSFLFESNLLLAELKSDRERSSLVVRLRSFFTTTVENALKTGDVVTAANLLWIASNVEKYVDYVSKERVEHNLPPLKIEPPILDTSLIIKTFETMMKSECAQERPMALEAFLASINDFVKTVPTDETKQKIFSYACLASAISTNTVILENNEKCDPRHVDAKNTLFFLRRAISEVRSKSQNTEVTTLLDTHLPPILKGLFPRLHDISMSHKNADVHSIVSGGVTQGRFCVSACQFESESESEGFYLYNKALSDEEIQRVKLLQLFPETEDYSKIKCFRKGSTTFISFPEKKIELKFDKNSFKVEIKTEEIGAWATVERKQIEGLTEKYIQLFLNGILYFCSKDSFSIVYKTLDKSDEIAKESLSYEEIQRVKLLQLFPETEDYSKIKCFRKGTATFILFPEKKIELKIDKNFKKIEIKTEEIGTWATFENEQIAKDAYLELFSNGILYFCSKDSFSIVRTIRDETSEDSHIPQLYDRLLSDRISTHGREPPLFPVQLKTNPFSSFEHSSWTSFLVDSQHTMQEIQFNRLGITLKKSGENTWVFAEQKEWHVAKEQFIPHFGQKTGFLVLENEKGQKKVLLPTWRPCSEKGKSLTFPYEYDFSVNEEKGRYVECDIKNDLLQPKNYEARLCLARIYLEKGFIDEAEELLYAHDALVVNRPLSEEEKEILKSICEALPPEDDEKIPERTSGDIGPRTMRLRVHAQYLYERNASFFPTQKRPTSLNEIEECGRSIEKRASIYITHYLSRLNAIDPLDKEEEYFLVKKIEVDCIFVAEFLTRKLNSLIKEKADSQRIKKIEADIYTWEKKVLNIVSKRKEELKGGPRLTEEVSPPEHAFLPSFEPLSFYIQDGAGIKEKWNAKMKSNVLLGKDMLPFNPKTVTAVELEPYLPHLKKLLLSSDPIKKGKATSALYFMAFFSDFYDVKDLAKYAINESISEIKKAAVSTLYPSTVPPSFKGSKKKPPHIPSVQDLPALGCIEATPERADFLLKKRRDFFEEKLTVAQKTTLPPIFDSSCPEISNATVKKKFMQAQKDLEVAFSKAPQTTFVLKKEIQLQDLCDDLSKQYNEESKTLVFQEEAILQSLFIVLTADPISHMQFASKKRELPSIDELCILCVKKDSDQVLKKLYTELSPSGIESLKKSTRQYLIQKQFCQSVKRSLTKTQDVLTAQEKRSSPEIIQSLIGQLGGSLFSANSYEDTDVNALVYLLVETIADIRLRSDQVQNISLFIEGMTEGKNIALQMIMGAGKTAVIQPILAFLFANNQSLSVVDVPEANFPSVKIGLSKLLGTAFNQYVFSMNYERTVIKKDPTYLDAFYKTLKETTERGGCFLRTPKIKHSMITSFYEALSDCSSPQATQKDFERLEKITKICELCELHECLQIDEGHFSLNPKTVFKYPLGQSTTVDRERAEILSELLVDVAFDEEIALKTSLDFVDAVQKRCKKGLDIKTGTPLTKESFKKEFQETLAKKALELLKKRIPSIKSAHDSSHFLLNFLQQKTPFDTDIRQKISEEKEISRSRIFIKECGTLESLKEKEKSVKGDDLLLIKKLIYKKERDTWIRTNVPENSDRELVGVCAEAISTIFTSSLFKICGSHYGVDTLEGKFIARPYVAPKTPKKTIYQSTYEQVIYTTQLILYYGIPRKAALSMILKLQAKIQESIEKGILFKDIPEYKKLQKLLGENPSDFRFLENPPSETYIKSFSESISKDKESIMDFLKEYAYCQIKLFTKDISSTPQTLAGSTKKTNTYTGTPTEGILPYRMESKLDLGTNGKIILAVEEKMATNLSSIVIVDQKIKILVDTVQEQLVSKDGPLVFVDSGGWLKEENIRDYAEKVLDSCSMKRTEIKGIIYHKEVGTPEEIGVLVCLQKNEQGIFEEIPFADISGSTTDGSFITIITQKHEVGTNILQPPNARAIVSVRKGINAGELLQSIFRMRGILEKQAGLFLITDEVRQDISSHIWEGLLLNPVFITALRESHTKDSFLAQLEKIELPQNIKKQLIKICQKTKDLNSFSETFIKEYELDSASVWRYATTNEAMEEQDKNFAAARHRMREVVEKPIRSVLESRFIPLKERLELFKEIQSLVIQEEVDSPFSKMSSTENLKTAEEAIENQVQYFLTFIKKVQGMVENTAAQKVLHYIRTTFPEYKEGDKSDEVGAVQKALNSCVNKEDIADVVRSKDSADQELEIEIEEEMEQEQEQEQEQEVEIEAMYATLHTRDLKSIFSIGIDGCINVPIASSALSPITTLKTKLKLNQYTHFFLPQSKPIEYSSNLFLDKNRADTDYFLPGRFLLAVRNQDTKQTRFLLLGINDAEFIKKQNAASKPPQELVLMTLTGEPIAPDTGDHILSNFDQKELILARVQGMLCTGKTLFSPQELSALESCLKGHLDEAKKLRKFFEDRIRNLSAAEKQYNKSDLRSLLYTCSGEQIPRVVTKIKSEQELKTNNKNFLYSIANLIQGIFSSKMRIHQFFKKKFAI